MQSEENRMVGLVFSPKSVWKTSAKRPNIVAKYQQRLRHCDFGQPQNRLKALRKRKRWCRLWNSHGREVKAGINNIAGSGTFARVGVREWGPAEPVTLLGSTGRPGRQSTSRTRGQETRTSPRTRRLQYSRERHMNLLVSFGFILLLLGPLGYSKFNLTC